MGTFELTFRLPFNREQEQLLRTYAATPEAVTSPPDTLTFGEVTLKIDGKVVRPPWSTRKKLRFTDTDWVFGIVVRFANAVLGLRTGEPRQYVHFMDDPLQVRFDREDGEIRIAVEAVGSSEPTTIASTKTSLTSVTKEARSALDRLIETLSGLDPGLLRRPPFNELKGLLADLRE